MDTVSLMPHVLEVRELTRKDLEPYIVHAPAWPRFSTASGPFRWRLFATSAPGSAGRRICRSRDMRSGGRLDSARTGLLTQAQSGVSQFLSDHFSHDIGHMLAAHGFAQRGIDQCLVSASTRLRPVPSQHVGV